MALTTMDTSLPTLYEHYTTGGINTGLSDKQNYFTLNEKNITLYSGAMHYFRIPQEYWRDRLRKARAAGLNAVETYVPWNLHEPQNGVFEFGDGKSGSDYAKLLDLQKFLQIAQEEDLLAIVRPGPYICAEWEFGGLPSWLLREKDVRVRTSEKTFMKYVARYFQALLSILTMLQFTRGGPIIAFQIENEYGNTVLGSNPIDKAYLNQLKELFEQNNIVELLFTSDTPSLHGDAGSLPGVLQTANFQSAVESELVKLQKLQPDKPLMVMEYWTGWYDHWTEIHHRRSADNFADVLTRILEYPASFNMYMFHGGTNFGFLNGANVAAISVDNNGFKPDTTSYDYDAPLLENGDYTDKYNRTIEIIKNHNRVLTKLPSPPPLVPRTAYSNISITEMLTLQEAEEQISDHFSSENLISMEMLPMNNNSGQSYGYIIYKKTNLNIPANATLKIKGRVCDSVLVLINGELKSPVLKESADLGKFGYWRIKDSTLNLGGQSYENATLELVVENWGRNNYGFVSDPFYQFAQYKGLWQGALTINDIEMRNWEIIPLEFRSQWNQNLKNWQNVKEFTGPALYRGTFDVQELRDTYVDMRQWSKGIVIVNGFVIGRHVIVGPQLSLYLPAPFLKIGKNEIIIFEHFKGDNIIAFAKDAIYNS